jgi:N-acyl-D-amino-acid deacylase
MQKLATQIGFDFNWRTLAQWFAQIEDYGLPLNMGTLVGHNALRAGACEDAEAITPAELDQICGALQQALADGALGMSTGLVYTPGSFADTGEIIELAKAVAKVDGCYVSHIRNERENLQDAIDEAIEIGRQAGVRVLVSHLKAAEKPNWGKLPKVIETIESARENGVRITFEVYPYTAVSTKLSTFIPKDALNEGPARLPKKLKTPEWRKRCVEWLAFRKTDYEAMILITESLPGARAKTIKEVAARRGLSPADAVVDVLISDPDAWIVYHCISESDMDTAILWPNSIVCSDSWSYPVNAPNRIGDPHPRTFGAFSRFLERYVFKTQRITFGQAVCKISSCAADWLGINHRGRIAPGCYGDVLLLDPKNVAEKATFKNPRQFSAGTDYLWVNGTMMIRRRELLEHLPGKVIRRRSDAA